MALIGEAARAAVVVEKEAVVGGEHRRRAEGVCVDVVVRFGREKRREAMPRRLSDNDILGWVVLSRLEFKESSNVVGFNLASRWCGFSSFLDTAFWNRHALVAYLGAVRVTGGGCSGAVAVVW